MERIQLGKVCERDDSWVLVSCFTRTLYGHLRQFDHWGARHKVVTAGRLQTHRELHNFAVWLARSSLGGLHHLHRFCGLGCKFQSETVSLPTLLQFEFH